MSCALILDTETTGLEAPEVIELAWMGPLHAFSPANSPIERKRFRPGKPVSLGALATHHILDEELEGEEPWPGSWALPAGTDYIVGHHIDFDHKAIGSPPVKRICTLALCRRLWPEADSHSLSAMTYFHSVNRRDTREWLKEAHGAAVDVALCVRLLAYILAALPHVTSWEQLHEQSEIARIPLNMPLGKYGPRNGKPGMPIKELRRLDPGYIGWCLQQDFDPYLLKALRGEVV